MPKPQAFICLGEILSPFRLKFLNLLYWQLAFFLYFHLWTLLLFIFLHLHSSFKCRKRAMISTFNQNQEILEFKEQDVFPQETLPESLMLTCCNLLFTLWQVKEFSSYIFVNNLCAFQCFAFPIFLGKTTTFK